MVLYWWPPDAHIFDTGPSLPNTDKIQVQIITYFGEMFITFVVTYVVFWEPFLMSVHL